ncbi:MucBP domain-containing protein [Lactococcus sp.]|uniref:MucBP domain-containing protein n=1 Tax=Lactococcus sp. TaxID=44273 RepID=UPI0035AE0495
MKNRLLFLAIGLISASTAVPIWANADTTLSPSVIHLGSPSTISKSNTSIKLLNSGVNQATIDIPWQGAILKFDSSGTLHLPGGTVTTDMMPTIQGALSLVGIDYTQIKKIVMDGPLKIKGSAYAMFMGFTEVTSIDLSQLDTSEVTDMSYMFDGCYKLQKIDITNFKTPLVERMTFMFAYCTALQSIDLSNFDNSLVSSPMYAFTGDTALAELKLGTKFHFENEFDNGLADISPTNLYTGKWEKISGSELPAWTSTDLQKNYRGETDSGTFVWQTPPGEDITVKYVSLLDNSNLDTTILKGNLTRTYQTEQKSFSGYSFDRVDGNSSGTFTSTPQTVTYFYKKDDITAVPITVIYIDNNNKKIAPSETLTGNIGSTYFANKKAITGYSFQFSTDSLTGSFTNSSKTIVLVYTKNSAKQEISNVYRLYNTVSKEHLYTTDSNEYRKLPLISKDWKQEGINFKAYKFSNNNTVNIYRVYNPKSGEHLFTDDFNEVKVLTSKYGWKNENIAFFTPKSEGKAVYRLFNSKAGVGSHLFTADFYERMILTTHPKEWKYEGIAWYAVK